jgi:Putative phage metallopeptidase
VILYKAEKNMSMNPWKAPNEVFDLLSLVKDKNHNPRLSEASVVVSFDESKPFINNKLNLGKVTKFSPLAKLWQMQKHDFCISISRDLWQLILTDSQKEAYLDLQLLRCDAEYLPKETEENGKKIKIKDEYGRIQYTDQIKLNEDGEPKWKVLPLDLEIFLENVKRYGLWMETLEELASVCVDKHNKAKQE